MLLKNEFTYWRRVCSHLSFTRLVLYLVLLGGCSMGWVPDGWAGAPDPAAPRAMSLLEQARAVKQTAEASRSPERWAEAGQAYEQAGNFNEAARAWTEAATLHEQQHNPSRQVHALIHVGYALQQIGQYQNALRTLQVARQLADVQQDARLQAATLGQLGKVHAALGNDRQALELLIEAVSSARKEKALPVLAIVLNDFGNALAVQGMLSEAISAYMEGGVLARESGQTELSATALMNAAMASIDSGQVAQAKDRLERADRVLHALPDSHGKAFGLLNLALGYEDLRQQVRPEQIMLARLDPAVPSSARGGRGAGLKGLPPESVTAALSPPAPTDSATPTTPVMSEPRASTPSEADRRSSLTREEELLKEAAAMATRIGDRTAESYALGYRGQLYEQAKQYPEALRLTRQALFAAQQAKAPESLYRWHWQIGRILVETGKPDEAIDAYRLAVSTVQPIRQEFSGYEGRRHSFRDSVGPVFYELADLLLKRAVTSKSPQQQQALLIQARDISEQYKAAELQDYFKDGCVKAARARSTTAGTVPKTTAIIYPIILPDRLELLLYIDETWKRVASPVAVDELTNHVREFRRTLQDRESRDYLALSRQLYQWVLRPLEQDLAVANINTLVFVPDGPLRTIPMAALHDGKEFLIARFAIAVTPGMDLTDLRPIDRSDSRVLSMGITEAVQGFAALPYVKQEVEAVHTLYRGVTLLDQQFKVPSMQTELQQQPYSIVHIASHGVVERDVKSSFLLTYDDKITMDQLSQLIGMFQFRKTSLDLLTLSACETAIGDDRAALGLAGVAVKAGARSAMASLWFIDDQATSHLVQEFYKQLQNPTMSKAAALQQAQLKIANEPGHAHPSYWAPFLLINNWL